MIPESEWKFFEGTEQRIKHLVGHQRQNRHALYRGEPPSWDPVELSQRLAGVLQDLDYPTRVEKALGMDPTPEQTRHLHLHRQWALGLLFTTHPDLVSLQLDLEERVHSFSPRVEGRSIGWSERRRILREEEDQDLRETAWRALTPLAEALAEDLTELIRRRETLARAVTGIGFPAVAFLAIDQDRTRVVTLLDEVERYTRQAYREMRKDMAGMLELHELEPWDLEFGLSRMEAAMVSTPSWAEGHRAVEAILGRWGFPSPNLEMADLPTEQTVLAVEAPRDVRTLVSASPDPALLERLLRGAGRSLAYTQGTRPRFFLQEPNPALAEAMGDLVAGAAAHPPHTLRPRRIWELRHDVAQTAFENLVYAQSDLEPHRLYGEVMEQTLLEIRLPSLRWPLDLTRITAPLHRASRVLGALIAAQLREELERRFPKEGQAGEAGAWLREHVLAGGGGEPWEAIVEKATGAPLGIGPLARELDVSFAGPTVGETDEISDAAAEDYFKDIDLSDLE